MNTNLSNLIQQTCSDEVYSTSYHDFFLAKLNKLAEKNDILAKIINEETLTSDDLSQVFEFNNNYYSAQTIADAVASGVDTLTDITSEHTCTLDQLVEESQDKYVNADIICQSLSDDVINAGGDASAKAILLMNRIGNKYNNISGNAKQMLDNIVSIAGNTSTTVREKVSNVYNLLNPSITTTATYDQTIADVEASVLSQCTGTNPFTSIGLSLKQAFSEIDLSSVKSAVVSGCNTIKKAFVKGINWLKDNAGTITANIARTTTELVGATNTDWKSLSGGDGTVDNAYMIFDDTLYKFYLSVLQSNHDEYQPLRQNSTLWRGTTVPWQTVLKDLMPTMQLNIWYRFDIPGAHVYFIIYGSDSFPAATPWNGTDLRVKMVIKYRPVDLTCINAIAESSATTFADLICDATNLSACFDPTLENAFYTLDSYMFSCCLLGKALSCMVGTQTMWGTISNDYSTEYASRANYAAAIGVLGTTGTGINPHVSGHSVVIGGITYDDPTNEDFGLILSSLKDNSPAVYTWFMANGSSAGSNTSCADYICGILSLIFSIYGAQEDEDNFTPFIKTTSIAKGSYHIRSDKDNVDKVLTRTGIVVGAIAAVGVAVAGLKVTKSLKLKAVTSNLQAGTIQSTIQEKLKNGIAPTAEEYRECYKRTKKAVRLNKLTGGFASVTTGLSTWGSDSLNLPGIGTSMNDIQKLISH